MTAEAATAQTSEDGRFTWNAGAILLAGRAYALDPDGALWCEATRSLIVSDLHLEKGSFFAVRRQFLPPYDTAETLRLIARLVARYRPRRVIALGDSFHDRRGPARMAESDRTTLTGLQSGRDWIWITGNHDAALDHRPPGDHVPFLAEDGIRFVHIPSETPDAAEIAGHLHPCAVVRARGRSMRRRALITCGRRVIMPAFGAYTGGLNLRDPAIAGLFPQGATAHLLGAGRVYAVPPHLCWPD